MYLSEINKYLDFYDSIKDKKLPVATAYKLNRIRLKLEEEQKCYQEALIGLLRDYGEFDENGNIIKTDDGQSFKIKADKIAECNKKVQELNDIKFEAPHINFTFTELEPLELSIEQLQIFNEFITVEG